MKIRHLKKLKKLALLTLAISPLLLLFPLQPAEAQGINFEEDVFCRDGYTLIEDKIKTSLGNHVNEINSDDEFSNTCVSNGVDGVTRLAIGAFELDGLYYCSLLDGYSVAFNWEGTEYFRRAATHGSGLCCPTDNPYYYLGSANSVPADRCCPEADINDEDLGDFTSCLNSPGAEPYPQSSALGGAPQEYDLDTIRNAAPGTGLFYLAETRYFCEASNAQDGCTYDTQSSSLIAPRGMTEAEVTGDNPRFLCLDIGDELPNDPTQICGGGTEILSEEDIERLGIDGIRACQSLSSIGEQEECEACLRQNNPANLTSTFVYTSIGCVDTSRDGLITRVFQIGVGLIGGFAVLRLIQAAFKMQQRDPAEMQEARENIVSALFAILMLVGALTLLRFIGVDVLGIVSDAFLS